MVIVMQEGATDAQIQHVIDRLVASGFNVHRSTGESRSEERRVGKECRSRWSPYH